LREQMAAIQRQLGEGDEGKAAEIAELGEAIAKAKMPKEVDDQARKELRRLQSMPEAAGEYGMVRTYLDWLIDLPWAVPEEAPIDIAAARRILDEDHFGLEKIKRGSSSIWRFASSRRTARRRSSASSGLQASARPRSVSRSRGP
jgi:ATP-dependent Lon protease